MYNKEKFAELLKIIQGERSINTYAKDSGVSAAYISKLKRGLYPKAPSPEIIKKLHDRKSEVRYGDLMVAAGHILPIEESDKLRLKSKYIASKNPMYQHLHPNLEEELKALTKEEKDELDEFINSSTPEDLYEFILSLQNIDELNNLVQMEEEAEILSGKPLENLIPLAPQTVKIPILGKIACGDPIDAIENIDGYLYKSPEGLPGGDLIALQAKGDSMSPTIPNGAHVIIRKQKDAENGELVAVRVNGDTEATLKRLKKQGDTIILMPDNPSYSPIVVDQNNPVSIIGKVVSYEVRF